MRRRLPVRHLVIAACAVAAAGSVTATLHAAGIASFGAPTAAVPTADGGFLVADAAGCFVDKYDADGVPTRLAGTGTCGVSGDGGPATEAQLAPPVSAVPTADGGVLIAGYFHCTIRKVSADGIITTVAGNGGCGYSGDGGPATSASFTALSAVPFNSPGAAVSTPGNGFLITDPVHAVVRKVAGDGTISTVAGTGVTGQQVVRDVSCPTVSFCAASDESGNVSVSANANTATPTWNVNRASPTSSGLNFIYCPGSPTCVASDSGGNFAISTNANVAQPTWTATSGIPLSDVSCTSPTFCAAATLGGVLVSTNPAGGISTFNQRYASANPITGVSCPTNTFCAAVDTAGNLITSTTPDTGGSWTAKTFDAGNRLNGIVCPSATFCVATDNVGNVATTADPGAVAPTVTITNVDGTRPLTPPSCPTPSFCATADNAGNVLVSTDPGTLAPTFTVTNVAGSHPLGGPACPTTTFCMVGDIGGRVIRSTNPTGGAGAWDFLSAYGAAGSATNAQLALPTAAVPTADGGFLLAQAGDLFGTGAGSRLSKVSAGGTISTVAGNGIPGYSGDGAAAADSQLRQPISAVPEPGGGYLVADTGNAVVRRVNGVGTISTVAGNGVNGESGDGGPATAASLFSPTAAVPLQSGGFLIGSAGTLDGAPAGATEVRSVSPSGTIDSIESVDPPTTPTTTTTTTTTTTPEPPPPAQPSNQFTLGKLKRNLKKGTAKLSVAVPGPGTLALSGKNVAPQRPANRRKLIKPVAAAGTVSLLVKPKGKAKRKLADKGKLKLTLTITFQPTGGSARAENAEVTLKRS